MVYAFTDKQIKIYYITWFLFGIILGTAIFNCLSMGAKTDILIYGKYLENKIEVNNVNKVNLFIYVLGYRMKELIIFIVLGLTNFKKIFHAIVVSYLGIKASILLCSLTVIKGKMAIIWFMILTQPHIIIYIFTICYLIKFFNKPGESMNRKRIIKTAFIVLVLMISMCFLEAFINPTFIKKLM